MWGGFGGGLHIERTSLLTDLVVFTLLPMLDLKIFVHLACNFGIESPRIFLVGIATSSLISLGFSFIIF